jgi:hypothetical protein
MSQGQGISAEHTCAQGLWSVRSEKPWKKTRSEVKKEKKVLLQISKQATQHTYTPFKKL